MFPKNPESSEEWTTQALNIQGSLFERLCQYLILQKSSEWTFRSSKYPVEFPPSFNPISATQTKNSELDLWVTSQVPGLKIELLIECKKNNPEFVDWVFFPCEIVTRPQIRTIQYYSVVGTEEAVQSPPGWWAAKRQILSLEANFIIANDARETRGDYEALKRQLEQPNNQNNQKARRNFTKTANDSITSAAHQIALATQAIIYQEKTNNEARRMSQPVVPLRPPWRHVFLPMIVTTAHLSVCHVHPEDVDLATGEVPLEKVRYERHPFLFFNYALPPALQYQLDDSRVNYRSETEIEQMARLSILVVQSTAFPDILDHLVKMRKDDFDGWLLLPDFP